MSRTVDGETKTISLRKTIFFVISAVLLLVFIFLAYNNFQTKADQKSPIKSDVNNVTPENNLIQIDYPKPGDVVKSPLEVRGKARGTWYFEATFPVTLYYGVKDDWVASYATAQGEWMTEDFVPFTSTITFPEPTASKGTLVLERSNPSDLPENHEVVIIPVKFR